MIGVINSRRKQPAAAPAVDRSTGRTYLLIHDNTLEHTEAVVLSNTNENGQRTIRAVASNQRQRDDLLRKVQQETNAKWKLQTENRYPQLFHDSARLNLHFGGGETFRCVARLVLNVLAARYPQLVRESWLDAFKQYIYDGGDDQPWVFFSYSDDPRDLTPAFEFSHRIVLLFDEVTHEVHAKVFLGGVIELGVRLGSASIQASKTCIYELNLLAQNTSDDVHEHPVAGLALSVPQPTLDPFPVRIASKQGA